MCGFGVVHPLPGIWDAATLNTSITLPIGGETYAAYALHAWPSPELGRWARVFAGWSALAALVIGAGGQVTNHVMNAWGWSSAPWPIVTVVSCIPVLVLGMGTALARLIRLGDREPSPATVSVQTAWAESPRRGADREGRTGGPDRADSPNSDRAGRGRPGPRPRTDRAAGNAPDHETPKGRTARGQGARSKADRQPDPIRNRGLDLSC